MKYIHKKIGETPLEALRRFRENNPAYQDARLSYAGRLDPMASGKLLILEDEENDGRDKFLVRDKRYEFQILFGVATDTYDLLGLIEQVTTKKDLSLTINQVNAVLNDFVGEWEMSYPVYSSKTVEVEGEMVPLWKLARTGKTPEVLPTKDVEVYDLVCTGMRAVSKRYITNYITRYITKVSGDFRQEESIDRWLNVLEGFPDEATFPLASCSIRCSSGTYVRRLAHEIGQKLRVPTLAFSITRTEVG